MLHFSTRLSQTSLSQEQSEYVAGVQSAGLKLKRMIKEQLTGGEDPIREDAPAAAASNEERKTE